MNATKTITTSHGSLDDIIAESLNVTPGKNGKIATATDTTPGNVKTRESIPTVDNRFLDLPDTITAAISEKLPDGTLVGTFDAIHTSKSGKTTGILGVAMVTGDASDWRPSDAPFDTFVVGASKKADNAFSRLLQVGAAVRGGCVMAVPVQASIDKYGIPQVKPARVVSGIQSAAFGLPREDFMRFDPVLRCVGTGNMMEGATAAYILVRFFGFNVKAK